MRLGGNLGIIVVLVDFWSMNICGLVLFGFVCYSIVVVKLNILENSGYLYCEKKWKFLRVLMSTSRWLFIPVSVLCLSVRIGVLS